MFNIATTSLHRSPRASVRAVAICALVGYPTGYLLDSRDANRRGFARIAATEFMP
jgi:ABC-type spermidine/putrescine transport system permease subunit I